MVKKLRLLMLLTGNRNYSCSEIAERFELSERTIFRYLNQLEDSGFVLERKNGRYRLAQNDRQTKDLIRLVHFSDEEAYIFFRAISSVEEYEHSAGDLIKKLHALYDFRALRRMKGQDNLEKIQLLKNATEQQKQTILNQYHSSSSGKITDRKVEPFAFMPDYKAVWALDIQDKKVKQFKISRIQSLELTDQSWQFVSLHQLPFTDAFRMSANQPAAVVEAVLTLKAYNLLKEDFPLSEKFIEKAHPKYHLKIPIADFHGIGRFVLGLPGEIEVHKPKEFIDFLREMRKKFNY